MKEIIHSLGVQVHHYQLDDLESLDGVLKSVTFKVSNCLYSFSQFFLPASWQGGSYNRLLVVNHLFTFRHWSEHFWCHHSKLFSVWWKTCYWSQIPNEWPWYVSDLITKQLTNFSFSFALGKLAKYSHKVEAEDTIFERYNSRELGLKAKMSSNVCWSFTVGWFCSTICRSSKWQSKSKWPSYGVYSSKINGRLRSWYLRILSCVNDC